MIRPEKLNKGDKVAIVSLSMGLLGMPFIKHELDLGIKRMKEIGLEPVIMPNAKKDTDYLFNHPEERASDLKKAFQDDSIKAIICAIGGDDTYKTFEYLLDDEEFIELVHNHPKIFMGFSDTTNNHIMFSKLGLETFYGPTFLTDFAELDKEMLPYTKEAINMLFEAPESYEIKSSPVWYMERTDFTENAVGTPREVKEETHGFETINGSGVVTGKLFGGCIESLYDAYVGERYGNENEIYNRYNLLPTLEEYEDMILFIEPSNEKIEPEKLEIILNYFKDNKILETVKGIIVGKPMDETYYEEYKNVFKNVFESINTPVLYNVNFGHAYPRTILPYGAEATVDFDNKKITIDEPIFKVKSRF